MSVQISLFGSRYVPTPTYKPSKKVRLELEKEHSAEAKELVGRICGSLAVDDFELGELRKHEEASFPGSWETLLSIAPFAAYVAEHGTRPKGLKDLRSLEDLKPPFGDYPLLASMTAWRATTYGVPMDFADARVDEEDEEHGFVSSVRLLSELNRLGPSLGLDRDAGELGPDAAEAIANKAEPFGDQVYTWLMLRWMARESVDQKVLFQIS